MPDSPFSSRDVYSEQKVSRRGDAPKYKTWKVLKRFVSISKLLTARLYGRVLRFIRWLRSSRSTGELVAKLFRTALFLCAAIFIWLILYFAFILIILPDVDEVGALFAAESTVITDRNGIELYRIHGDEDRTLVPLSHISDYVEQATIAIEDERFYERGCFDPRAFGRAVWRNVFSVLGGSWGQGGSTITQQFAKNALIGSRKKRITRKVKEYVLSCQLEGRYSKDEVLELYLNRIPYGHNAHGVEQASKIYFAKSSSGLTLAESSILAALPQLPSYLSPYGKHVRTTLSAKGEERFRQGEIRSIDDVRDDDFWIGLVGECFKEVAETSGVETPDEAEPRRASLSEESATETCNGVYIGGRTDQVLRNMQDQGFIGEEERLNALDELQTITFERARENIRAPHFVMWVREKIKEQFRDQFDAGFLESGGLRITTSLDWDIQQIAEGVINEIGQTNIDLYGAHNAAILAADPESGHILAYVGNRDYWDEETDGNVDIVQAPRQPGSSFKPFSYAAAFLNGYSPATVLYDVPTKIGDDEPENFDSKFMGPLTIRKALGASRNIPAAKSFFLAGGEDAVVGLAASMGIPTARDRKNELTEARGEPYEYGWPLSLGAAEIPLYEMVQGYATFARAGKTLDFVSILKIEDRDGNILYESSGEAEEDEEDVLDPRAAYMITSILSDESVRPAGYWRDQLTVPGFKTAAKTGTSNKCLERDEETNVCTDSKPDNTWTIGYTSNLVAGAWSGNASGGVLYVKAAGLDTASPIWRRFMISAHRQFEAEPKEFEIPEDLESAQVSELSGELASSCTPESLRRADIFFKGDAPKEFDSACRQIEVDKLTGLLASDECPAEVREAGSFLAPRSALPDRWPLWEQAVQSWARDLSRSPVHSKRKLPDLMEPINMEEEKESIFWKVVGVNEEDGKPIRKFRGTGAFLPLPLPLAPSEECKLSLTPGRLTKPTLKILSPSHGGTATAPSFRPQIEFTVGNAVRSVKYELDGRVVANALSGSSLEPLIRLPRRFETEGIHNLKVTLTDSYFNQVSSSVRFTFKEDAGIPQVRILAPPDGAVLKLGQEITIIAEARDPGGFVDRVQFFLGDQLLTTRRSSPFQVTFTLDADPGETVIRVVGIDAARNEGVDEVGVEIVK